MFELANYIEAGFWMLVGVVFAGRGAMLADARRAMCFTAAAAFVAFGASDIVEAQTGAWWRPWWLLMWKGGCVIVLAGLLRGYLRRRRREEK